MTEPERQTLGAGAPRVQLATYPQSPLSGPLCCCDVTDLYQAFSQPTGPGRLWISLSAGLLDAPLASSPKKPITNNTSQLKIPLPGPRTHLQNLTHTTAKFLQFLGKASPHPMFGLGPKEGTGLQISLCELFHVYSYTADRGAKKGRPVNGGHPSVNSLVQSSQSLNQ